MATVVFFHAHPDDEAISTAGTAALATRAGHRAILVLATRGEHGEPVPGVLAEGEQLGLRRLKETFASAGVLGVKRVEFLGYVDSGMVDAPTNDGPYAFCGVEVDAAAARLAAILIEEDADILVGYDEIGQYGHPDHVQVHRVARRAAELAGTPRLLEATINRDHFEQLFERMAQENPEMAAEAPDLDPEQPFGMPAASITHAIDVAAVIDVKRAAMRCHSSQIGEDSMFLTMPDEVFAESFGVEWFIEVGRPRGEDDPFRSDFWAAE